MSLLLKLTEKRNEIQDSIEGIHNYYERPVKEELLAHYSGIIEDDSLVDIFCYALNMLPAKYIRHDVDMSFFMTSEQSKHLSNMISFAVFLSYLKIKANIDNLFELINDAHFPVLVVNAKKDILFVSSVFEKTITKWDSHFNNLDFFIDNKEFQDRFSKYSKNSFIDFKKTDYSLGHKVIKLKTLTQCFDVISVKLFQQEDVIIVLLAPTF